jgi:methanogenic corrinoid protein MtbC1
MTLVYDTMIPALEEVGELFETAEYFLPEMLTAAKAMQAAMDIVRPHLAQAKEKIGTFVIGTVAGDIHDIGKNLCIVMLEGVGFETIDLGINVPTATFVSAVREHNPDVVGMSAFLTTTVPEIELNMAALADAGLRDSVKVMVGGAPVTSEYASKVGADGFATDASSAAREAKLLLHSPNL